MMAVERIRWRSLVALYLRNGSWLAADQGVRALTESALLVLLARLFTQREFGYYQLALSAFMAASIFTLPGFNGTLLRALARGHDGTLAAVMRLSWRWSLAGVAALVLLGGWWLRQREPVLGWMVLAAAPLFPFFHLWRRWQVVLHARERFRERTVQNMLAAVILLAGVSVAAVLTRQVLPVFLTFVALSVILHGYYFRRARRAVGEGTVEAGWRRSGYRLMTAEVFHTLYAHVDKLVLGFFLGAELVALYAVAIVVAEGAKLLLGSVLVSAVPRLHRASLAAVLYWLRRGAGPALLAAAGAVLVLWAAMPLVIPLLFSSAYAASVAPGRLYLLILPLYVAGSIFSYLLISQHREGAVTAATVAAGVCNVLAYVVLIPRWGILGAVAGSIIYYAVLALGGAAAVYALVRKPGAAHQ